MPDQTIVFRAVADGAEVGRINRTGNEIEATTRVASQTLEMLQRRFRMTPEQVVTNLASRGWSNGQIAAETA